jgi:hypothetical protein
VWGRAPAVVEALAARGLRITHVKHVAERQASQQTLRLIVTIRDLEGSLVSNAIVLVRPLRGASDTIATTLATFTNAVGQAGLEVPVPRRLAGRDVHLAITARTPRAHSVAVRTFRLPARRRSDAEPA